MSMGPADEFGAQDDAPPVEPPRSGDDAQWAAHPIDVRITPEMKWKFQQYEKPLRFRVRAFGLDRTHPSMVADEIREIEAQTTVDAALDKLVAAKERWAEMELFRDISFDGFARAKEDDALFADVRFTEGERMSLGVFTEANRVTPEVRFSKANLFGRGYTVFVDVQPTKNVGVVIPDEARSAPSAYTPIRRVLEASFPRLSRAVERGGDYCLSTMSLFRFGVKSCKPFIGRSCEYGVSRTMDVHTRNKFSNEWVTDSGVTLAFGREVPQTLTLSTKQRTLRNSETSAVEVSECNGIAYEATYDRRLYPAQGGHPRSGFAGWLSAQAAGAYALLGSADRSRTADHLRLEGRVHHITPLPLGAALHLQAKAGAVWGTAEKQLRLNDRLYAETEYVRGFSKVGPRLEDGNGLSGGDTLAAASAMVCFPLPQLPVVPPGAFAGHLFANAAGVGWRARGVWRALADDACASVGFGAHVTALPLLGTMGRLEFNASFPLTTPRKADEFKRWKFGLQWAT